jgi:hypothetical protein
MVVPGNNGNAIMNNANGVLLLDGLDQVSGGSDMGTEMQLRLQMYMDRYSKTESTLSNIMKKMSDTAQSTTQNLK